MHVHSLFHQVMEHQGHPPVDGLLVEVVQEVPTTIIVMPTDLGVVVDPLVLMLVEETLMPVPQVQDLELQTLVVEVLVLLIVEVVVVQVEVESLLFVIKQHSNPVHKPSTDPLGDPWRVL